MTYQILNRTKSGKPEVFEVDGEIIEETFGIHTANDKHWTITHLRTGYALDSAIPFHLLLSRTTVVEIARRLAKTFDWNFDIDGVDPALAARVRRFIVGAFC